MVVPPPQPRSRVVVAGAGLAGIEGALALREFAGDRAAVTVIDPGGRFAIPASAAGSAFGFPLFIDAPLSSVVARTGAALRRARLVAVDARTRLAMLAGGEMLAFEHLLIAVGPRLSPRIPEALTFRGQADVEDLRGLVEGVLAYAERGGDADLAVVIPSGCGWQLAGYELALMAREHLVAAGCGDACRVAIVTAEEAPLEMFGPLASRTVAAKLERTGIEIVTGSTVRAFDWGRLVMGDGTSRRADRIVSLPVMRGPELGGLPMDADGFVRCEPDGTVPGAPGVRVVGDAGTFPVKRGWIACQQADSVAASIARGLGAEVGELPFMPAMPDWLSDGADGRLAGNREPASGNGSRWWPVPKVSGRFLAPFLHDLQRLPIPSELIRHSRARS